MAAILGQTARFGRLPRRRMRCWRTRHPVFATVTIKNFQLMRACVRMTVCFTAEAASQTVRAQCAAVSRITPVHARRKSLTMVLDRVKGELVKKARLRCRAVAPPTRATAGANIFLYVRYFAGGVRAVAPQETVSGLRRWLYHDSMHATAGGALAMLYHENSGRFLRRAWRNISCRKPEDNMQPLLSDGIDFHR